MSTTNERMTERSAKTERRERPVDLYEPHFPIKKREGRQDRAALFDPHFPTRRT